MKLLLDAGNTRVKWRLLDAAGQRCAEGAAAHEDLSALAADCARWAPEQALGCTVASEALGARIKSWMI